MKLDIAISAPHILPEQINGKLVIVIDVLRATSVICTALSNGAKDIIPVETIDEAKSLHMQHTLLAGERMGFKIENFDLGNSPLEYTRETVFNKTIILTTTNGTRAIKNSLNAKKIVIAGFLNLNSVVNYILEQELDVCIVCAGTENHFSLDDAICAGNIIAEVYAKNPNIKLTDAAFAHKSMYISSNKIEIFLLEGCNHYSYLINNGFEKDVSYCLQKNLLSVLPIYQNNKICLEK